MCPLFFLQVGRWSHPVALNHGPLPLAFAGVGAFGAAPGLAEGGPVAGHTVAAGAALPGGGAGRVHSPRGRMGEFFLPSLHIGGPQC